MTVPYNHEYLQKSRINVWVPELRYLFYRSRFVFLLTRILLSIGFACVIHYAVERNKDVSLPTGILSYVSVVLGMLLAFRTNTAYDRYWEGRKLWNTLEDVSMNLFRGFQCYVTIKSEEIKKKNDQALKNVVSTCFAIRYYLLGKHDYVPTEICEILSPEILDVLTSKNYANASNSKEISSKSCSNSEMRSFSDSNSDFNDEGLNLPYRLTFELSKYIEDLPPDCLKAPAYSVLLASINSIVSAFKGCLRIQTTPMPFSYSSFLYRSVILYLLCLPFLSKGYGYLVTVLIQALVTFLLYGALAIAEEIEDPFGNDKNDLHMKKICGNIYKEWEFISKLS
ncbi:hypothetical protein BB560_000627 [Smittium megazygosporum]|uniref:Bestrophin homolog n=1 Tax=Smittium megazygosporum TaxID=133381 RepID=A0A2T9ZJT6_9FUNG|nr:hypothetical protein BB560_000627 [Smittium megazygosporum]